MGLWDRIKNRFKSEEAVIGAGETYTLKRQNPTGRGMKKVMNLAEPLDIEDLYESLEPGIYALDMYTKGTSGFKRLWGLTEVTGDAKPPATERKVELVQTAGTQLAGFLAEFRALKVQGKEELALLQELFGGGGGGGGGGTPKTGIDILLDAKADFDKLSGIFGTVSQGGEGAKYEGTIPMLFHPDVIPKLVDGTLNSLESRMIRWGLIEGKEATAKPTKPLIELPKKPVRRLPDKTQKDTVEDETAESETE